MNVEIIPNLHPMLVHFPLALTTVCFFFFTGARIGGSRPWATQWAVVGHWSLWCAAGSALVAAGLGWQAFNSVNHDDAGHLAMLLHRSWAVSTVTGLVAVAAWDLWRIRVVQHPGLSIIVSTGLLFVAISVTGWLGGELVYRHGLGVIALPQVEAMPGIAPVVSPGAEPSNAPAIEPPAATKPLHQHHHHHS